MKRLDRGSRDWNSWIFSNPKKCLFFSPPFCLHTLIGFYSCLFLAACPTGTSVSDQNSDFCCLWKQLQYHIRAFFLLQWSSTTDSDVKKQTHPGPAEKLLCMMRYWDKPQQDEQLCGTQWAQPEAEAIHRVEFTVQLQHQWCWTPPPKRAQPDSGLSACKLA